MCNTRATTWDEAKREHFHYLLKVFPRFIFFTISSSPLSVLLSRDFARTIRWTCTATFKYPRRNSPAHSEIRSATRSSNSSRSRPESQKTSKTTTDSHRSSIHWRSKARHRRSRRRICSTPASSTSSTRIFPGSFIKSSAVQHRKTETRPTAAKPSPATTGPNATTSSTKLRWTETPPEASPLRWQAEETGCANSEKISRGEPRWYNRMGIRERRRKLQGRNYRNWLHHSRNLRIYWPRRWKEGACWIL